MTKELNNSKVEDRLDWLDIAKGIEIICTIIGHTVAFGERTRNLIFSFHMPLFFLLAGYTIKPIQSNSFSGFIKKDFVRLIIPVFIIQCINLVVSTLIKGEPFVNSLWDIICPILWGNATNYGPLPFSVPLKVYGIGALWFLIALFWARCFYRLFDYKIKEYRFIILLVFAFLGMWIGSIIRLPHCLDMMPLILLFM
ncbi:MAG: acyltransferase family protein [Lachnospiraceae bacterium]